MKRLLTALLLLALMIPIAAAQEDEIPLIPFESETYGISGLIPDGWQEIAPGAYARAETANDSVVLAVQSAPLPLEAIAPSLAQQLALEALPEPTGQIETSSYTWNEYRVEIDQPGVALTVSMAIAETDTATVIVLLQSPPEAHDALYEAVFAPVVESIAPLDAPEAEEDVPYIQEEVTFSHGDITLAGTLTLPEGEGPHPAVVLITGSGAQDRDENIFGFRIFRQIADHLTRNGIAVLRYDDRGVGGSTGDFLSSTAQDFAEDASAAVDYLLTREDVDSAQIGLLGHSEGGIVAPITAGRNENVAFVILMASPAAPGVDTLLLQQQLALESEDLDPELTAALVHTQRAILEAVAAGDDEALDEAILAQYEALPPEFQEEFGSPEDFLSQLREEFLAPAIRFLIAYDPAQDVDALEIPVLAVYGSLDVQVDDEQNAPIMEELLANNPGGSVVVIEDANHLFQEAETGAVSEYQTLDPVLMPEFLGTITDWLLERVTLAQ